MKDFPKILSPFKREIINNRYVCTPKIDPGLSWVFTDKSIAVDKLDGTNVIVGVKDHTVDYILNRKKENLVNIWEKGRYHFGEGILRGLQKEYILKLDKLEDGQYAGELIGEKIQGNPYNLQGHLWVPFDYLKSKYIFKFWFEFVKQLEGLSDQDIYEKMSDLFKGLWSLFKRNHCKMSLKENPVTEDTKFTGIAAEGLVFYNKETGQMAKLRRDMFDWFKGRDHQSHHGLKRKSK